MKQTSCLVVIDMQEGIFKLKQPVHNIEMLIDNVRKLAEWARENNFKVFFTTHENNSFLKPGSSDSRIIDELTGSESDVVIPKRHPSVFKGTGLADMLEKEGISKLYITGLISNGCVREACLDALEYGFQTVLVRDAHSTFYRNAEKVIQETNMEIEKAGAVLTTTEELLMAACS